MNKKLVGLLFSIVLVMAGCAQKTESDASSVEEIENKNITVTDANGESLDVPLDPEKVVVFDMGILDTLSELNLEDSVVGTVTENLPEYLSQFENSGAQSVGNLKEPDLEAVYDLDPDLIIISGRQLDYEDKLNEIAPTLYLGLDLENYWSSFESNMKTIGKIFVSESEMDSQISTIKSNMTNLKEKAESSNYSSLITILNEGSLSAFGKNSRYGMIYDEFGFTPIDTNIEASIHGQSISFEYVLSKDPDLLFVVDRTRAVGGDDSDSDLSKNPVIQKTTAYQKDHIIYLNPELWYLSGGGLQSMKLMIQEIYDQVGL
ncbi:siderophore ABC transporter substrate-binding protein [Marinilactibacillus psychrotolerans]|uniref:Iron ABC transporter substrate-binding protein n=1 Tax=Marinilactibacillus psychrotolerans TaxID=191770 RepID=A0AAV3WRG9_9LACT|nr:siderophore ABC transporter substrate-binding protein [Marinilactibacillus psychrotolerans]GEL66094.1 iron ABC transporter substrate-binding protein [Marinilactibacillus psychrotolerans]GEQ34603.1 iron ABC transporter substrate-binding protein [Marinilactibacillus psychrotolerans]SDB98168.1 iron complex transport system substrate-binding protein [Marinilactibacillus psychrotolerans]